MKYVIPSRAQREATRLLGMEKAQRTYRAEREEGAARVAQWRAEGGYEGAIARQVCRPAKPIFPYPNHRTCAEWTA